MSEPTPLDLVALANVLTGARLSLSSASLDDLGRVNIATSIANLAAFLAERQALAQKSPVATTPAAGA